MIKSSVFIGVFPTNWGRRAFWVEQTRRRSPQGGHRLGETLAEEVVACLLGGYGVRAWVGLAAFERLRRRGLVSPCDPPSSKHLEAALAEPLSVDGYGPIRYRFPNQRAERIAAALRILSEESPPTNGHELRDWLLGISGIGPKTASWVARNWSGGDGIAIIDVHIHRAGLAAGFFPDHWKLSDKWAEQSLLDPQRAKETLGEVEAEFEQIEPEVQLLLNRQREIAARLRSMLEP